MAQEALYIGWDVGGWEGDRDGLAVLQWHHHGHLELCGEPKHVRLADRIKEGLSVDDLLEVADASQPWRRVVIGVDAPLGWPAEFVRLVGGGLRDSNPYLPGGSGEIKNRLAYRLTDRVVHDRCGKKPLSGAFDKLGGNATKAITVCQLLHKNAGAVVVPQEEEAEQQRVVICEAYPALWKQHAREEAAKALEGLNLPPLGADESDAVLCALTAACYDNQAQELRRGLPELWLLPKDESAIENVEPGGVQLVRQEGWIYFPKAALKSPARELGQLPEVSRAASH